MTRRMGYCPYGTHGDHRSTWLHYETPECKGLVAMLDLRDEREKGKEVSGDMGDFGWAVVQHSGYGYNHKPGFEHAVESRGLASKAERSRVEKAGGLVFDSYMEAEDFAEKANYPEGGRGIYPRAAGTFSRVMVDGLRVYIPVRNVIG